MDARQQLDDAYDAMIAWQDELKRLHEELLDAQADLRRAVEFQKGLTAMACQVAIVRIREQIEAWEAQKPT